MLAQCYFDGAGGERQLGRTVASRLLKHPCSNVTDMQNAHNKLTILLKFSNFNTHSYQNYEEPTLCGCCGELFLESSRVSLTRWVALPPQAQRRTISTCGYLGQQMLAPGETHLGLNGAGAGRTTALHPCQCGPGRRVCAEGQGLRSRLCS